MAVPRKRCIFRCICSYLGCVLPIQYIPSANQASIRPLMYVLSRQDTTGAVRPRRNSSRNIFIVVSFVRRKECDRRSSNTPLLRIRTPGTRRSDQRPADFCTMRASEGFLVRAMPWALNRMFPNSSPNYKQRDCGRAGTDSQEITRHATQGSGIASSEWLHCGPPLWRACAAVPCHANLAEKSGDLPMYCLGQGLPGVADFLAVL